MKTLNLSDLHFDEGKEAEYRWGIFPWLSENIIKHRIKRLLILGDLTEKKDNHSSDLVNRLVTSFTALRSLLDTEIIILKGNHDYDKDDTKPFFGFLNSMSDVIKYISMPEVQGDEIFLPHTKYPEVAWSKYVNFSGIKTAYMHQHVNGARFANNYVSDKGSKIDDIVPKGIRIYAGDIHLPQNIGSRFTYVGAPYSVDYGDHYNGRGIITEKGEDDEYIYPDFLIKWSITINKVEELYEDEREFQAGDRIKVKLKLHPSDYCMWHQKRDEIIKFLEEKKLENRGVMMETIQVQKRPRVMQKVIKGQDKTAEDWIRLYGKKEELSEDYIGTAINICEEK